MAMPSKSSGDKGLPDDVGTLKALVQAERTRSGLIAARARGRFGGRPKALDKDRQALAVRLYNEKEVPVTKICSMMGISKPTLYAYVRAHSA